MWLKRNQEIICNFCGKDQGRVDKLIAADDAYICNECVNLSYEILHSEKPDFEKMYKDLSAQVQKTLKIVEDMQK